MWTHLFGKPGDANSHVLHRPPCEPFESHGWLELTQTIPGEKTSGMEGDESLGLLQPLVPTLEQISPFFETSPIF